MAHGKYLWALGHGCQFWREVFDTELSLESLKRPGRLRQKDCKFYESLSKLVKSCFIKLWEELLGGRECTFLLHMRT